MLSSWPHRASTFFYAGCNLDRGHSADHYQRLPLDGFLLFWNPRPPIRLASLRSGPHLCFVCTVSHVAGHRAVREDCQSDPQQFFIMTIVTSFGLLHLDKKFLRHKRRIERYYQALSGDCGLNTTAHRCTLYSDYLKGSSVAARICKPAAAARCICLTACWLHQAGSNT